MYNSPERSYACNLTSKNTSFISHLKVSVYYIARMVLILSLKALILIGYLKIHDESTM